MAQTVNFIYEGTESRIIGTITDEEYEALLATGWTEEGSEPLP